MFSRSSAQRHVGIATSGLRSRSSPITPGSVGQRVLRCQPGRPSPPFRRCRTDRAPARSSGVMATSCTTRRRARRRSRVSRPSLARTVSGEGPEAADGPVVDGENQVALGTRPAREAGVSSSTRPTRIVAETTPSASRPPSSGHASSSPPGRPPRSLARAETSRSRRVRPRATEPRRRCEARSTPRRAHRPARGCGRRSGARPLRRARRRRARRAAPASRWLPSPTQPMSSTAPNSSSAERTSRWTAISRGSPLRSTTSCRSPPVWPRIARPTSDHHSTALPFTLTMRSPGRTPERAAGEPSLDHADDRERLRNPGPEHRS